MPDQVMEAPPFDQSVAVSPAQAGELLMLVEAFVYNSWFSSVAICKLGSNDSSPIAAAAGDPCHAAPIACGSGKVTTSNNLIQWQHEALTSGKPSGCEGGGQAQNSAQHAKGLHKAMSAMTGLV